MSEASAASGASVEMVDLERLPGDEQLCVTTLQGLVNRAGPRLYLLRASQQDSWLWWRELTGSETTHTATEASAATELEALLARHRAAVRGTIVYDPAVPDTLNVAVTLAGLEDSVVASPRLAEQLAAGPLTLPVRADLRGRFRDRFDAYAWQFGALWPRCTHRLLVAVDAARGSPPGPYGGGPQDFAVAHGAMVIWLDPRQPAERTLLAAILCDMSADSAYLGWFPGDVAGEFDGVELASRQGVYVVATDHSSNLTALTLPPPPRARPDGGGLPSPPMAARPERAIYITFTITEGDNLQYMQHRMRQLWDDPGRGQVPLNWTVSPLAAELAPTILDYYRRTGSPLDLLIAGPSGAGYVYPNAWPASTFGTFTRRSGAAMRRLGLKVVWVLNRRGGRAEPLAPAHARAYARDVAPLGVLLNYERGTRTMIARPRLPQSVTRGVASAEEARAAIAGAERRWRRWGCRGPLFLALGVLAWAMTPSDVASVVRSLGPEHRVVLADEYFRLVRLAHGLPARPDASA